MSSGSCRNCLADEQWMRYSHGSPPLEFLATEKEQEENFSCPRFCMGNLETEGRLCLTGSLSGASASSSSGGLPWRCHGASPMGGLKPRRGTSVHVAFQLSREPLLWVGSEELLGAGAER